MHYKKQMQTIKDNVPKVYDSGHQVGRAEGYQQGIETGKRMEHLRFWEVNQAGGTRTTYSYCYAGLAWCDDIYDPQYNITATSAANYMFAYTGITDTKVPIDLGTNRTNKTAVFESASKLVTIRKLILGEAIRIGTTMFSGCTKLANLTIEGTIGYTASFQWSPLTVASMKSIITHLKNYAGTTLEGTYKLTFSAACWAELEASGPAPDGGTWKDYVYSLGWTF